MPAHPPPPCVVFESGERAPIHTILPEQVWVTGGPPLERGAVVDLEFETTPRLAARCEVIQSGTDAVGLEVTGGTLESVREALRAWSDGKEALVLSTVDLAGPPRVVLVVEDDVAVAAMLKRALEYRNFEVLAAKTADRGIQILERKRVGAVLLDWMLPGVSGEKVLTYLRSEKPEIPVAVVSGVVALEATRKEVRRLGATEVFSKPFSIAKLSRWVAQQLSR